MGFMTFQLWGYELWVNESLDLLPLALDSGALFWYPIRPLFVSSCQISKLQDVFRIVWLVWKSTGTSASEQNSKQCIDLSYQSCGFGASQYLTIRHIIEYWKGAQIATMDLIPCTCQLGMFPYAIYMIVPTFLNLSLYNAFVFRKFIVTLTSNPCKKSLKTLFSVICLQRMSTMVFKCDCLLNSLFSKEYIPAQHYWDLCY